MWLNILYTFFFSLFFCNPLCVIHNSSEDFNNVCTRETCWVQIDVGCKLFILNYEIWWFLFLKYETCLFYQQRITRLKHINETTLCMGNFNGMLFVGRDEHYLIRVEMLRVVHNFLIHKRYYFDFTLLTILKLFVGNLTAT